MPTPREGATSWSRSCHRLHLAVPGLIDAFTPAWGLRASTWTGNQRHQSFNDRQPGNSSRPPYPILWVHCHYTGLAWPSLGLMASGKKFDRRQPRSWNSHNETLSLVQITLHTSQTNEQSPQPTVHSPRITDQDYTSQRARAADKLQRRQHVKLWPSVREAVVDYPSETAAHCDLYLQTRLPKALRQAPRARHSQTGATPPTHASLSKNPCAAF